MAGPRSPSSWTNDIRFCRATLQTAKIASRPTAHRQTKHRRKSMEQTEAQRPSAGPRQQTGAVSVRTLTFSQVGLSLAPISRHSPPPRGRASARWIGRARCGPIGSRPLHDLRRPTDQHAQLPLGWPCHGSCSYCTGSNRGRGRRDIARLWTETTSSKSGRPRCRTVVAGDVAAEIAEFLGCAWLTDAKEGGQARR